MCGLPPNTRYHIATQTPVTQSFSAHAQLTRNMKHDVIAMVGLPARGKTFISKNIVKFLNDRGYDCSIFNVGEYRRLSTDYTAHDFFSSDNEHALQMRNQFAIDALEDLCTWLSKGDNRVAIYDATNSTRDRRDIIYDTVVCKYNFNLLFIESICNKPNILDMNIRHKANSPDYSRYDNKDYAIQDFKQRISHYESRYEPLGIYPDEATRYSFIQIVNAGEDWHFHHCRSEVQMSIMHFLIDLYAVAPICK